MVKAFVKFKKQNTHAQPQVTVVCLANHILTLLSHYYIRTRCGVGTLPGLASPPG